MGDLLAMILRAILTVCLVVAVSIPVLIIGSVVGGAVLIHVGHPFIGAALIVSGVAGYGVLHYLIGSTPEPAN